MTSPTFGRGDKIFAKVRGYPPWPARVEDVADETPNKVKYHVYFYGTGQTAVCKQEDLYSYIENKEKFGKPMKNKYFNVALLQIDSDISGLSPAIVDPQTPLAEEGRSFTSFTFERNVVKKSKLRANILGSLTVKDTSSTLKNKAGNVESTTLSRKLSKKLSLAYEREKLLQDGIIEVMTPKSKVSIRFDFKRENELYKNNEKAKLEWETRMKGEAQKLKSALESGELLPEDLKLEVDEMNADRLFYKAEEQLTDIEKKIKNSLSLNQADPDNCLNLMDELLKLNLNPRLVKLHPEVVDTINKLRGYIGNTSSWKMTAEETEKFTHKAASIRAKAEQAYHKMVI